jgi:hypothetical protein
MPVSTTTPRNSDSQRILEEKILTQLNAMSGGPSGSNIYTHSADPNGVKTAAGPAICLGTGGVAGQLWAKTTTGTSNNEWVAILE